ncbi:hypothetical protein [Diplocloster agilis]|uniref:hypothetical protein n=1 Tax=Diplocloster agilis TaxID=2850323 RepID=UPI0008227885|nr:hypothetical protein [Suonthocola fibrivorans]MCU6734931.1 hypothetical protein [Suonthocola fibrivorans]SCJ59177.1 Uncharacterised protein [uncultured Clostridium sp.]
MEKLQEMQYHNLRENFNEVVKSILGENYYNEGMDVYTGDAFACRDIINKFNSVKTEMVVWRAGFWVALAIWIATSVFS